jgi:hypothetical protein
MSLLRYELSFYITVAAFSLLGCLTESLNYLYKLSTPAVGYNITLSIRDNKFREFCLLPLTSPKELTAELTCQDVPRIILADGYILIILQSLVIPLSGNTVWDTLAYGVMGSYFLRRYLYKSKSYLF